MRFASEPRRALTHPLWWAALGLLLLNDHLLKGAGLLPGWLTGKLSDLAGLIVAPVLAAALLRARTPAARLAAFALPTLPFVAINLAPAAARATETAMASVGVPWRIWTDPTDLVALAVLPVAWWVANGGRAPARRRALEGVALGLGAFACIATSPPPGDPFINASAWMVNHTDEDVDVRLRWIEGELACDEVSGQAARALSPDRFDEGLTFHLEPDRTAPIDYANAMQSAGMWDASERGDRTGCDAVMVEADGLPRTIVFWTGTQFLTVGATFERDDSLQRGLRILPDEGERLRVESEDLEVAEAVERTAPSACFAPEAVTYEWSVADLPDLGVYRLEVATEGPDGCWQLDLADDLDESTYRAFLCVPAWAFPFRGGDLLRIEQNDEGAERELRILREHEDGRFGDELLVARTSGFFREGSITGNLEADDCGADRMTCGAYVSPAALVLEGGDAVAAGAPMAMPASTDADGRAVTVALGRAETVLVSHPDCEPGQQQLGAWADVLVLYEEEIE